MLKNDKVYRGMTNALVALFMVSAVIAILAFTAPQPALAMGENTPRWTQCYDYGCDWNGETCRTQCISTEWNVWYRHLWYCYSDGVGWYWYTPCTCRQVEGPC